MVSHERNGYTDSQGFTYDPCMGEGVNEIQEFIEYCKTVTQDRRDKIIACFTEAVNPA